MNPVKAIATWFIFEFLLLFAYLVLTGTMSTNGQPLALVVALCTQTGLTVYELGIGVFILGTFGNLVLLFLNAMRS